MVKLRYLLGDIHFYSEDRLGVLSGGVLNKQISTRDSLKCKVCVNSLIEKLKRASNMGKRILDYRIEFLSSA